MFATPVFQRLHSGCSSEGIHDSHPRSDWSSDYYARWRRPKVKPRRVDFDALVLSPRSLFSITRLFSFWHNEGKRTGRIPSTREMLPMLYNVTVMYWVPLGESRSGRNLLRRGTCSGEGSAGAAAGGWSSSPRAASALLRGHVCSVTTRSDGAKKTHSVYGCYITL